MQRHGTCKSPGRVQRKRTLQNIRPSCQVDVRCVNETEQSHLNLLSLIYRLTCKQAHGVVSSTVAPSLNLSAHASYRDAKRHSDGLRAPLRRRQPCRRSSRTATRFTTYSATAPILQLQHIVGSRGADTLIGVCACRSRLPFNPTRYRRSRSAAKRRRRPRPG